MAATAWLRDVTKRNRLIKRADGVVIDVLDEEDCIELLRRMAKQNGAKAADCELTVKGGNNGRTTRTYRL